MLGEQLQVARGFRNKTLVRQEGAAHDTNTTPSPEAADFLSFHISSRRGPALSAETGQRSAVALPRGDLSLPSATTFQSGTGRRGRANLLTSHLRLDQPEVRTQSTTGAWQLRSTVSDHQLVCHRDH